MPGPIHCTKCQATLSAAWFNTDGFTRCPSCNTPLRIDVYPAYLREKVQGSAGESIIIDSDASCFFHPDKKAVTHCEGCGRFLCALCDVELNGHHLCTDCLKAGKENGKFTSLQNHRTLYDSMALRLAIYPVITIIFFYLTIITAPMAMYMAIRHWNSPMSIVRHTRTRSVFAILISGLQILGWATLIIIGAG